MAFDWIKFLDSHNIEYVTSGPNVSRGNVAVHCPFCGHEDQSHHMSISLFGRGYACWRKEEHRGKNPNRLVMALLGCSYEHAASITGSNISLPNDFLSTVKNTFQPHAPKPDRVLQLPQTFRSFDAPFRSTMKPFCDYLRGRGFDKSDRLTRRYGMYWCALGPFKGRIIFTISYRKQLVSWTGRTIYPTGTPRYLAATADPEKAKARGLEPALGPPEDYVLWFDKLLKGGEQLFICEGPFDALKVAVLGRPHSIYATCLFTSSPSVRQLECLHELVPRFRKSHVLLDQGTLPTAMKMTMQLSGLGVNLRLLPPAVKDPALLSLGQLLQLSDHASSATKHFH